MIIFTSNNFLNELWDSYNHARVSGDKKKSNDFLKKFIGDLKKQNETEINSFVDMLCESIFDKENPLDDNLSEVESNKQFAIQYPLFKEIVVPVLVAQHKKSSAKHIRWIAQFEQWFYSDYRFTQAFLKELNIDGTFESISFLEQSYSIDNNQKTLDLLLHRMAQDINNFLHETPIGMLVVPEVLNKKLLIFRNYWQQSINNKDWQKTLIYWELIASHWAKYCENEDQYSGFEQYLKINEIDWFS
jgi:hypothetical protein